MATMVRLALFSTVGATIKADAVEPLAGLVAERARIPDNSLRIKEVLNAPSNNPGAPQILVVGDSWAEVTAAGSAVGQSFFQRSLSKYGCKAGVTNIAIDGSTASEWSQGALLEILKIGAKSHDYVWISLVGNDALFFLPGCLKKPAECVDELLAEVTPQMYKIVDAIHEANPNAKVTGFGYDTMFGGIGCSLVTHLLFPRCWLPGAGGNSCFNKQLLRIQHLYDTIASNRSFFKRSSILGATQVAAGDPKASTGADRHIDMDKMGPAKYWPDYELCFHPGVIGGEDSGASVVMNEFVKSFWVDELQCSGVQTSIIV
ncbi:unnamed protein product [Prorocentrum cordatum]|uniref:SGNH hydrolase-type esterase domain-containing protein n=1 Tax=Prorocentrum cordatum TaxID=2364126 RepID=A0ABN9Q8J2_9DINO|nr:unnamed protein product [Polarella glacialis]